VPHHAAAGSTSRYQEVRGQSDRQLTFPAPSDDQTPGGVLRAVRITQGDRQRSIVHEWDRSAPQFMRRMGACPLALVSSVC
jgi:hypothetical protein